MQAQRLQPSPCARRGAHELSFQSSFPPGELARHGGYGARVNRSCSAVPHSHVGTAIARIDKIAAEFGLDQIELSPPLKIDLAGGSDRAVENVEAPSDAFDDSLVGRRDEMDRSAVCLLQFQVIDQLFVDR